VSDLRQFFDKSHGAAAAIFLVCALALAFPWLFGSVTIPWDAKAHFQPQFAFLAHALHSGQSPFWTPNVFGGSPQIADPQSLIFSPFFLIAAWLVPEPSFRLEDGIVFAMLAMGGLALIFYFRDRGWGAAGALVAALAFAFGGSAAWRIQHTGQVMSLSWLPVTLFLLARTLDRRSIAYGAAAGVAAAFLALGRDQVALLSIFILSSYALFRLATDEREIATAIAPLSAGALCGIAVMALPLLWTLDLAANSNRPAIDLDGAFKGSLPPGSFLTLICANLFDTDGPLKDFWGPPSAAFGTTDIYLARNMTDVYMGALPLLALLAAFRRGFLANKEIRFFAVAALLLAFYALGRYTPVFELMFHFPGVDLYRRPADATFPLCAILAILAGYSVHLIVAGESKLHVAWLAAGAFVLLAIAFLVAILNGRIASASTPLAEGAIFLAIAVALLAYSHRLAQKNRLALLMLMGAVMTLDLAVSNRPNESTALPSAQFDALRADTKDETIAFLRDRLRANTEPDRRDRIELAAIDFHWPNASLVHGFDHDLGYNPIRLKLFEDATGAGDHLALPEQRVFSKLAPSYRSPLYDLMGLRYIASGVRIEQIDKNLKPDDFKLIARTKDAFIYENPRALPRVLIPTCALRADFTEMMRDGVWPEVDFRETVLLEETPICHSRSAQTADPKVRIISYENTRVTIDASAPPGGGYVVLNDVWHPYWIAEVDGQEAPILRANVMFRAVVIPEGRHQVTFRFEPLRGVMKRFALAR
jgi:hypothetical protein